MSVDRADDHVALERVHAAGTRWTGQEYVRQLRDGLAGRTPTPEVGWVSDIVFAGDGLPDDVYFEIILAAVDEAGRYEDVLWCLADGPVDHLVGRGAGFNVARWSERFHAERSRNRSVDRMFRVVQRYYAEVLQRDAGWWSGQLGYACSVTPAVGRAPRVFPRTAELRSRTDLPIGTSMQRGEAPGVAASADRGSR